MRNSVLVAACLFLVFACTATAAAKYKLTTLVSFDTHNGSDDPESALTADASGNLYGTTYGGGPGGTVFEVAIGSHALSTLALFDGPTTGPFNGDLLADANGNLYGTTPDGGADGLGSVFKLAAGTHTLTTLASFGFGGTNSPEPNGAMPNGGLIADASGNLYGTTQYAGAYSAGTVFELANDASHTLSTVASFNDTFSGGLPQAGLLADASGNLFGTTVLGGANGSGTVFELAAGTHTLTTLASVNFNAAQLNGGVVADASGNLYGTTSIGGANGLGTVFELAAGTHTLTTLASFNEAEPNSGLLADASGNLFGTTTGGGANDLGTVFELRAGTHTPILLAAFGGPNGSYPRAGLIADANGNLYGTTAGGGDLSLGCGCGTVFELSPVPGVDGDYNGDGVVDAADYTVWRETLGSTTDFDANGDNTGASAGVIDQADYEFWRTHFGQSAGSGAALSSAEPSAGVPEPYSLDLAALGMFGLFALSRLSNTPFPIRENR